MRRRLRGKKSTKNTIHAPEEVEKDKDDEKEGEKKAEMEKKKIEEGE